MTEEPMGRVQALSSATKNYRRAVRAAQLLSWGHTAALGVAAASLVIGGIRITRMTRK